MIVVGRVEAVIVAFKEFIPPSSSGFRLIPKLVGEIAFGFDRFGPQVKGFIRILKGSELKLLSRSQCELKKPRPSFVCRF